MLDDCECFVCINPKHERQTERERGRKRDEIERKREKGGERERVTHTNCLYHQIVMSSINKIKFFSCVL